MVQIPATNVRLRFRETDDTPHTVVGSYYGHEHLSVNVSGIANHISNKADMKTTISTR